MKTIAVAGALLFFLLTISCRNACAQDYLITVKGDSVPGEIKPIFYGPEKKVQVITADKKKTLYSIFQTRSYQYKGQIYEPVKNDKGYVFMKLLKGGYLSLYAFQLENQVSYDGLYLVKKDGTKMEVPNLTFKKQLTKFLEDCAEVSGKIDKGELTRRKIETIVDEYNTCVDQRTIDHNKVITQADETIKKISAWDLLEEKIKSKDSFEGKADALEMVSDIKGKIKRGEKVPNFLTEGLRSSLSKTDLSAELESALNEIKN